MFLAQRLHVTLDECVDIPNFCLYFDFIPFIPSTLHLGLPEWHLTSIKGINLLYFKYNYEEKQFEKDVHLYLQNLIGIFHNSIQWYVLSLTYASTV